MSLVDALAALTRGDRAAARRSLDGRSLLAVQLARYLDGSATGAVYDEPAAFEAFIDGGGNVDLYRATSAALARRYEELEPARILDVGSGNGRALVPALRGSAFTPDRVDLLEPSAVLLATAARAVSDVTAATVNGWNRTLEDFLVTDPEAGYELVESTFALHTLPPDVRTTALRSLAGRTAHLAVVEFDVPVDPVGGPAHLEFLARTYERGLSEYDADQDLVAQGFLMPVLVGQLAPDAVRSTYEQPATAWAAQVEAAGFSDVEVAPVHDYWSSPAFLLTATGA